MVSNVLALSSKSTKLLNIIIVLGSCQSFFSYCCSQIIHKFQSQFEKKYRKMFASSSTSKQSHQSSPSGYTGSFLHKKSLTNPASVYQYQYHIHVNYKPVITSIKFQQHTNPFNISSCTYSCFHENDNQTCLF